MFGNFDEYPLGATYQGFITKGTLMSDLSIGGFRNYVWSPAQYAEQISGVALKAVVARQGTGEADVIIGTARSDGVYGNGGADTVSGRIGGDYLHGGAGDDVLAGGYGGDTLAGGCGIDELRGGEGSDIFFFDAKPGRRHADLVKHFDTEDDQIILDSRMFTELEPGDLAVENFATGNAAADADDRIIYNSETGALYCDTDGTGSARALAFAVLSRLTGTLKASDLEVV